MSRYLGATSSPPAARRRERVDVLLLDKPYYHARQPPGVDFIPARGWTNARWLTPRSSLHWPTKRAGRSQHCDPRQTARNLRERDVRSLHATFVPFAHKAAPGGINIINRMIVKARWTRFGVMSRQWRSFPPMSGKTSSIGASGRDAAGGVAWKARCPAHRCYRPQGYR